MESFTLSQDTNLTYIISDIHLSANNCQAETLHSFLKSIKNKASRLIINGDLLDSADFHRLSKTNWKILSDLRKMSDELELVWVIGNHDVGAEYLASLIGAKWVDNYTFRDNGKKIFCVHGDCFDEFIGKYPRLTKMADYIYRLIQRLDKTHSLAKFLKHKSKAFLRNLEKIKKYLDLSRSRGILTE